MDKLQQLANLSVGRACFFAALAIWAVMMGLISDPVVALKSGAILTSLVVVVLFIKARRSPTRSYRETELWILLDGKLDMPEAAAQRLLSDILKRTFERYALWAAAFALFFWALALLFWALG